MLRVHAPRTASTTGPVPRWLTALALPAVIAGFGVLCLRYVPESVDDAYITLRYARHLAAGDGLLFNTAGVRVEGFSNFAWVVLLATLQKLAIPPVLAMKGLSIAAGLWTLLMIFRAGRSLFGADPPALLACALFGASSFHALWATDGLETMFFAALIATAVYLLVRMIPAGSVRPFTWRDGVGPGIVLVLLCLTRPEGVLYAMLLSLCLVAGPVSSRKPALLMLVMIFVTVLALTLFRLSYFGHLLPNTAASKLHPGFLMSRQGIKYLLLYARDTGILFAALALVGAIAAAVRRQALPLVVTIGAGVFFIILAGGDFMWGYRFVAHVAAPLALLAVIGLEVVQRRWRLSTPATAMLGLACVAVVGVCTFRALPSRAPLFHVGRVGTSVNFRVANYLEGGRPSPSDWILLSEAGIIPYGVDMQVYDYLGLLSPYREACPGGAPNLRAMFRHSPRYVLLTESLGRDGTWSGRLPPDRAILEDPFFREHYREKQEFVIPSNGDLLDRLYYRSDRSRLEVSFVLFERTS